MKAKVTKILIEHRDYASENEVDAQTGSKLKILMIVAKVKRQEGNCQCGACWQLPPCLYTIDVIITMLATKKNTSYAFSNSRWISEYLFSG